PQLSSFASEAVSRVTEALSSIAVYDDYQCVPRLLCEAAQSGSLGSSNLLNSVPGLQPLLTLLSTYSGVSTNPLFVFGRAVFLGMSKGNVGTCRYAYPLCPTDPEKLVYYLNNHNGGFFRFFGGQQQQQNLEQFYQGLSQSFPNLNPQTLGFQRPNINNGYLNYGSDFPYDGAHFNYQDNFKQIQNRIQNKPNLSSYSNHDSKWIFPENNAKDNDIENDNKLNNIDNRYTTVYIVRGNGDPNRPEILKLRPGEVVH
ncbi:unnamed protein product, partial [Leptidea sinapis]